MKKSKILAPALAVLTFSTAAAVTGTVAWYFAQRAVSIKATVTSFNPEAGLKVTLTEGVGTKQINKAEGTGVESPTNADIVHELIRDGSMDLSSETVYAGIRNRQGNALTEFKAIDAVSEEAKLKAGQTGEATPRDYYYATKFSAEFELTVKDSGTQYALYYDNSLLSVTGNSGVQESLRIGVVVTSGDADGEYFVVAPFRSEAPTNVDNPATTTVDESANPGLLYVQSETLSEARGVYGDKAFYGFPTTIVEDNPDTVANEFEVTVDTSSPAAENLVDSSSDPLDGEVDAADADSIPGYMGLIKQNETITVTVYTWFEGEDPANLAKHVDDQAVSAALGFQILEVLE